MGNILIIGGGSGTGKQLVENLKNEHEVYSSYNASPIDPEASVHPFQLDVLSDDWDLSSLPDEINGLVYCPGSINLKAFSRINIRDFENDYKLQFLGAVRIIQALLPNLKKGKASIVLFSSIAVKMGFTFHSLVSSSKGAIEGLTKSLAAEFAPQIRVNAISPSLTDTPLASRLLSTEEKKIFQGQKHPLKRIGKVDDLANAAEFLLSDKSSWISGQIINVDGGKSSLLV
tara:strand:+ start:7388 stop:8077 length:690 start_codon:yes stop_codon:yes gene_type:complete